MPCYFPLKAWRSAKQNPETGKRSLVFGGKTLDLPPVQIPCGRCIGCRLERSRQWAVRCVHEASLYEKNCFITLTFRDACPLDGTKSDPLVTLHKHHFQRFMKRLRTFLSRNTFDSQSRRYVPLKKKFWIKDPPQVRYFHCGEYGEKLGRPHHHACLFNLDFRDKILWKVRDGNRLYRSPALETLWPWGFSTIGDVTFESAAYVARYVVKKITGKMAEGHYNGKKPEFVTMSRGGKGGHGIGHGWLQKFTDDIYPADVVYVRGKTCKVPKYYDRCYELTNPKEYGTLRGNRVREAQANPDNAPRRLEARWRVQEAKAQQLKRTLQ